MQSLLSFIEIHRNELSDFLEYKEENIGTTWYDETEHMSPEEDE